jgi:flagellar M-ring protein FliF
MPSTGLENEKLLTEGAGIAMSKEQMDARKKIALESKLARTIKAYPQVEDVRVMITPAVQSAFARQSDPAKASVMLTMKPGERLNPRQVNGITRLVANAVEGLTTEGVTITDQNGPLTTEGDGPTAKAASRLDFKEATERQLEQKAQQRLDEILGPNQAKVVVNAEIDFNEEVRRKTDIDIENSVKERETKREVQTSRTPPAGGVPGVDSNIDERLPLLKRYTSGESRREIQKETQWAIPKTQSIEKTLPGEVKRLSVALSVSEKKLWMIAPAEGYEFDGKKYRLGEQIWVTRGQPEVTRLENLVKEMVGFNEARLDTFRTEILPFFYNNQPAPIVPAVSLWSRLTRPVVLIPTFLSLFVLALLAHYIARRRVEQRLHEQLRLAEMPSIEVSRAIQELAAQVVHNPEAMAATLKDWMRMDEPDQVTLSGADAAVPTRTAAAAPLPPTAEKVTAPPARTAAAAPPQARENLVAGTATAVAAAPARVRAQ